MTQPPFEIDSALAGEAGHVALSGELDIATVPRVQGAVSGAKENLPFIEDPPLIEDRTPA